MPQQDTHVLSPLFERKLLADALVTPSGTTMQMRLADLLVPGSGTGGLPVGTGPGTVAAGDDARIAGAQNAAQVLAAIAGGTAAAVSGVVALANGGTGSATAPGARTALGLGTAAVLNAGTAAGTLADGGTVASQGASIAANTTAIAARLVAASNLSDVQSPAAARGNLGLGGAAVLGVGTAAGTVAAGDDGRITGAQTAAQVASAVSSGTAANVSGTVALANGGTGAASASAARTSLGLGTAAVLNSGATAGTLADGGLVATHTTQIAARLAAASNLSDLAAPATARTNLGLGSAATLNVGTASGTVAAGDDARITGALSASSAAATYAPLFQPNFTGSVFSFGSTNTAASTAIEFGSVATVGSPFLDWHSSGTNNDFDVRLSVSGGSATAGQGALAVTAAAFTLSTPLGLASGGTGGGTASAARSSLGLGGAAVLNIGTATGTVAAGDDSRITGALAASTAAATYAPLASPPFTGTPTAPDLNIAGTGGVAGAWTSVSGTVGATSGAITTAAGTIRYKKFGRTVFVDVSASITANGTGAGLVTVAMPFAAQAAACLSGRDANNSAKTVTGIMSAGSSTLFINFADGSYPASNGSNLILSGCYEASS